MKIIACIPARHGGNRFPGKALANDTGKYLMQHVYDNAVQSEFFDEIYIATDDELIQQAAHSFGATVIGTSSSPKTGTDRVAEAVADIDADVVVNLQVDEPELDGEGIRQLVNVLVKNPDCNMSTLVSKFRYWGDITDPNVVKVVVSDKSRALYFSRSVIPYNEDNLRDVSHLYYKHVGAYAYCKDFLIELAKLPQSILESLESLEQLRALENGYDIAVWLVDQDYAGIDTPEQYAEFVKRYGREIR